MADPLVIRIGLEGDDEIKRKMGDVAKSFADATESISALGNTGAEALTNAAAAAQKFGASQQELQKVEGVINALNARARDSSKSFTELAGAYDKARSSAAALAPAVAEVVASLAQLAARAGVIGSAIVTVMTAAAKATVAFAGEINKINDQAIKLGQPVEQVDKFRAALEKAGVSAESIGQILSSKLASEQGIKGLEAFIRQLEQLPDSASRSKAAVEQFGSAGAELIRILQAGGKLTGFRVQGLISAEDAKRATELDQAINRLESSIGRLNTTGFAPALAGGIKVATAAVDTLGSRLISIPWTTAAQALLSPFQLLASMITQTAGNLVGVGSAIGQVGIKGQETSTIFTQWGTVATQTGEQVKQVGTFATVAFTSYGTVVEGATAKTQSFGSSIASIVWDNISSVGVQAWNALTGAIQTAYDWVVKYFGVQAGGSPVAGGAPIGSGGIGRAAAGGLLGGRGTGTSDSNLAWLSRGEYITPAHAVRQPGVLAFLEALRRSGGDLSRVLDGMGRFALGGMVPRAIPAFATGGLAGGGNNVTIQFPGLPAITGLRASSGVVDELRKAAALAQVRSGGRKPSRYS